MSVFIDSGIFVGAVNIADSNHARAKELMEKITRGELGTAFTSDYVVDETITAVLARTRKFRLAVEVGEFILSSPRIKKVYVNTNIFQSAWGQFKSLRKPMSFTDYTTLALMGKYDIETLASFDSGFDGLVKRIW